MSHLFKKEILLLLFATALASTLFWFTFYFNLPGKIGFPDVSLETVYANYDGPNYMAIAKCGYSKSCLAANFSLPQPLEYYPAHLPAFPLIIKLFDFFTTGPKAMLLATLTGSLLLSLAAYKFFVLFVPKKSALWLSFLLIFFPARLFVLRLVGAPETWFMAATLFSLVFFSRKKYLTSAIFAVLAQTLKTPGILLFIAYLAYALYQYYFAHKSFSSLFKKYSPYLLIPLSILLIFYLYKLQTGNFWAYFHSGDNFHLNPLPYTVFISTKSWIQTLWLEDIIYLYILALTAVYLLFKKYHSRPLTLYPAIFTLATLLVAHRDISRYLAPVYPFCFLAFNKILCQKPAKIIFMAVLPAIILFAINFVIHNTAPIADWGAYL